MITEPSSLHEVIIQPLEPCGTAVLTLAGSSGRIDTERAQLLALHGVLAMSLRWFGGEGQQPKPWHIPLETFFTALDRLAPECDRLVVMGTSFGAEAALLTAAHYSGVDAAIGFSPSSVVWGHTNRKSHWTLNGVELPFVPLNEEWKPFDDRPAVVGWYRRSLEEEAWSSSSAVIPVELIPEVVLVAGGDDQVWPSIDFAASIAERRSQYGLPTTVVSSPSAGHRTVLPGETAANGGILMARGGSAETDKALGDKAWPLLADCLRLRLPG